MKIIERDNYKQNKARVIAKELNEEDAKRIVKLLNNNKEVSGVYYQVVSDEWK